MRLRVTLALGLLFLSSVFCTLAPGSGPKPAGIADVGSIVSATLTAIAAGGASTPVSPSGTPALSTTPMSSFPDLGTISGRLSYPADAIPALRVVARSTADGSVSYTDTAAGTSSYALDVPVGTYTVVAYTLGGGGFPDGLAGGYTRAVPCGLDASCNDHTLIEVSVAANASLTGIDPTDWYAPADTFPPRPNP